jgi:hypothetical protein
MRPLLLAAVFLCCRFAVVADGVLREVNAPSGTNRRR